MQRGNYGDVLWKLLCIERKAKTWRNERQGKGTRVLEYGMGLSCQFMVKDTIFVERRSRGWDRGYWLDQRRQYWNHKILSESVVERAKWVKAKIFSKYNVTGKMAVEALATVIMHVAMHWKEWRRRWREGRFRKTSASPSPFWQEGERTIHKYLLHFTPISSLLNQPPNGFFF